MVIQTWIKNAKVVKDLLTTLPHSAAHLRVNKTVRGPKLSARKVAELKKAAEYHKLDWPVKDEKQLKSFVYLGGESKNPQKYISPYEKAKKEEARLKEIEERQKKEFRPTKHGFLKNSVGPKFIRANKDLARVTEGSDKLKGMYAKVEKMRQEAREKRYIDPMLFKGINRISNLRQKQWISPQRRAEMKRQKEAAKAASESSAAPATPTK